MKLKDVSFLALLAIIVYFVFYGIYAYNAWRWRECRGANHSVAYCLWEKL